MHYVADRLDLRKDIQLETTITSAHFDETTERWIIKTDQGEVIDAQFLVTCCGMLSAPLASLFPGQETFKGQLFHTARWPKGPVDLAGKRVGIIGNGATGDPDHRRQGWSTDRVGAHATIHPTDEEPEIHTG